MQNKINHSPAARLPIDAGPPTLVRSIILRIHYFCLLLVLPVNVIAQAYPPSGERLRVLAEAADFQIGYASRYDFRGQTFAELYERLVKAEFNIVTPENSLKWELVHPFKDHYDFSDMDELVTFAEQNDMSLHGHPLLWYFQNPAWVEALSSIELEAVMLEHISKVVGRYRGKIQVWDVINEALANTEEGGGLQSNIWFNAMGEDYIAKAFFAAHAADPDAVLIYNETKVGWLTAKSHEMYALVTRLLDQGVPLHGVGFQMHISHRFSEYEELSDNMQRYADLGLDVYITEFDVTTLEDTDPQVQAEVYEGVIRRCLAQVRCQALQIWGVDDFNSWRPHFNPLPFDDMFNVKPAYYGMQRALASRFFQPEEHVDNLAFATQSGSVIPLINDTSFTIGSIDLSLAYQSATLRYAVAGDQPVVLELHSDSGQTIARWELQATGGLDLFSTAQIALADIEVAGEAAEQNLSVTIKEGAQNLALDWISLDNPNELLDTQAEVPQSSAHRSGGGAVGVLQLLLMLLTCAVRRYRA